MRKSLIAKVVAGALVSVLVSACASDEDASSVNSAVEKTNKASEIWPKLDIEVKTDPAVETLTRSQQYLLDISHLYDEPLLIRDRSSKIEREFARTKGTHTVATRSRAKPHA